MSRKPSFPFLVQVNGKVFAGFYGFRDATSYAVGLRGKVAVVDVARDRVCYDSTSEADVRTAEHWRDYYNAQSETAE